MSQQLAAASAANVPTAITGVIAPSNRLTYEHLITSHLRRRRDELQNKGRSTQGASNDRTTINLWMESHGRTPSCPVGEDFGPEFKARLDHFLSYLAGDGGRAQYISDHKSRISRWRKSWLSLSLTDGLPDEFGEALKKLIDDAGVTVTAVGEHFQRRNTLRNWIAGTYYPSIGLLPFVSELEDYFGVPKNTLIVRLSTRILGNRGKPVAGLTAWRQRCLDQFKGQYRLNNFPPGLADEWNGMFSFFRSDSLQHVADGKRRNMPWRVRRQDGKCPTAVYRKDGFAAFFGALCLPEDSGLLFEGAETRPLRRKVYDAGSLTFALVTDFDLIRWYVEFKRHRSGVHTRSMYSFLTFCWALLNPKTGYLKQSPEYGQKIGLRTEQEWHERCAQAREKIGDLIGSIKTGEGFRRSKNPFEPIASLLELDHPVSALKKFARDMEAAAPAPGCSPAHRAQHKRDVFLVRLLTANPLRIGQVVTMTYRADNTGNLYQRPDGSWRLQFQACDFKNERAAVNDQPYDVPLPRRLWKDVEDYLFNHRPHLLGAGFCDYVLRPTMHGRKGLNKERVDQPMTIPSISSRMMSLTQLYIEDCPGFGPHAFRHLVATEFVKNHENGFETAAGILHDSVDTVRNTYARFRPGDKIKRWNAYLEGLGEDAQDGHPSDERRKALFGQFEEVIKRLGEVASPGEIQAAALRLTA